MDKVIFSAGKATAVASLSDADIRGGKPLAVMALWAGSIELPAGAGDTAVTGDIHDGKWRVLETRRVTGGTLTFDSLQAREITVVSPAADSSRAGKQAEAWVMKPWEAAKTQL